RREPAHRVALAQPIEATPRRTRSGSRATDRRFPARFAARYLSAQSPPRARCAVHRCGSPGGGRRMPLKVSKPEKTVWSNEYGRHIRIPDTEHPMLADWEHIKNPLPFCDYQPTPEEEALLLPFLRG